MKKLVYSLLFLHFLLPNQIVLAQQPINTKSCQGSQTPASNLVCFGDFENINQAQWNEFSDFEISAPTAGWQATGMIQTPDLLFGINLGSIFGGFPQASDPSLVCGLNKGIVQNPTGHFAHIVDDKKNTLREGFALPLKNALEGGKTYQLTFDFYTGCNNQLNILLAENRPCNHTVNSFDGFPDDNTTPLQKINCGGGLTFTPSQTIFKTVKGSTQWQTHKTTINVPKGANPIEYIIFYAHFNSNAANSFHKSTSTYYDNIRITEIPDAPVITPTVMAQCTPGEVEIDYDISVNSSGSNPPTNYTIKLTPNVSQLPTGISLNTTKGNFTTGSATVKLSSGGKTTLKLFLNLGKGVPIINFTALMNVLVNTNCGSLTPPPVPALVVLSAYPTAIFSATNSCTELELTADTKLGTHEWKVVKKNKPNIIISSANGVSVKINLPTSDTYIITHTLTTLSCGTFIETKEITIDCPTFSCPCLTNYNIGTYYASNTSIKNAPFYKNNTTGLANSCFTLQGTLVIDENYSLNQVTIKMGQNATILVKKGKKLIITDGSKLSSCTRMWTGIVVEGDATLDFNGNTIEDATVAIDLKPNAIINIKGNIFKKNDIGIRLIGTNLSDKISFLGSDRITGNVFTCENTTMLAPKVGQISSFGIDIKNCTFQIGSTLFTKGVYENEFIGIRNGINSSNVYLFVTSANFKKLDLDNYGLFQGCGILSKDGFLIVKNSNFEKINYGINTAQSTHIIDEANTFSDIGRGIFCDGPTYASIKNNSFSKFQDGITFQSSLGLTLPQVSEIKDNKLTMGSSTQVVLSGKIGIQLYLSGSSKDNFTLVRDNDIYDADLTGGINLIRVKSSKYVKLIHNNLFATKFNQSAPYSEIGIDIQDTQEIGLRDNVIIGKNNSIPYASIFIQGVSGARFCCNTMTNGANSLVARNMNNTYLRGSKFGSRINCEFQSTSLSPQIDGRNTWTGQTVLTYDAFHSGGANLNLFDSYIQLSKFNVAKTCSNDALWANGKIYPPLKYCNTQTTNNDDWFQKLATPQSYTDCDNDPNCTTLPKKGINNNGETPTLEDSLSARGYFKAAAYGDATNWELAKRLYGKLLEEPYLKDNNFLMDSFYNAANETNISKYARINYDINHLPDLNSEEEEQLTTTWNAMESQRELLKIYAENKGKYDEVKQQVIESETKIAENFERYQWVLAQLKMKRKGQIDALLLSNSEIKAGNLWEQNEQKVNTIYLKTFINKGETTFEDIKALSEIAYKCVASDGHNVLLARSLYQTWDKNITFDKEQCYCGEFTPKSDPTSVIIGNSLVQKTNINNSITANEQRTLSDLRKKVNIYPNPAQDELHIDISSITENSNIEIQINTLAGATLAKYTWFGNGKYDISQLQNGLYLCYVYENGKIIATKRITILK